MVFNINFFILQNFLDMEDNNNNYQEVYILMDIFFNM